MSDEIDINSGSDAVFQLRFKDGAGDPIPLSAASILEIDAGLEGRVEVILIDGAAGLVDVSIEGTIPIRPKTYAIRIQAVEVDGATISSPRIFINVK